MLGPLSETERIVGGEGRIALWAHVEIEFCLGVLSVRCVNCSRSIWQKLSALELRFLSLNSGLFSQGFLSAAPRSAAAVSLGKLNFSGPPLQPLNLKLWK